MVTTNITVTREDYSGLVELLRDELTNLIADRGPVQRLAAELEKARIVSACHVSRDVVTMNSNVRLVDLSSGESETYWLVYPEDANIYERKLSILAPIGVAILGYKVGDRLQWNVPGGPIDLRIDQVTQQGAAEKTVA